MYFVICVFMALCGLVTEILFTEMFHTWFKVVLAVGSSASAGYAIARGLRLSQSRQNGLLPQLS